MKNLPPSLPALYLKAPLETNRNKTVAGINIDRNDFSVRPNEAKA